MQSLKVLLLEDSLADADLIVLTLRQAGFDVEFERVESEEDFRSRLDPSLDIILADYSLPQFSGTEAVAVVKEVGIDVPLIIVSGSIGEEIAVTAIKMGAFDYLIKDRLTRLPQAIKLAMSQRALRDQKLNAEAQRTKLEDQLRQSHKMEAIGQLAGGVAHDFNNILQVIIGNAGILQTKLMEAGQPSLEIEDIMTAATKAADLTRRLLAFGRRQVLQSKDLDPNQLVGNLLKMVSRLIGENIRVDFIPGHQLGVVRADAGQIDQVLMNLLINARDAMPEGGVITIETENVVINGEYSRTHPWVKLGRYVLLTVTDTGCGMNKDIQDHIFEPFFTTKGQDHGTGLGLAMVYGIVKQHDGFIHVYSEPKRGTSFKIYLPIVDRPASAVGNKIEGPIAGGKETILIAEDEEAVRKLTHRILTRAGYTCHTAIDGADAVRVFEAHKDEIDLVLLDAIMPKMNGRVVFECLKASKPDVRILFCSGYSLSTIPEELLIDKGVAMIQKPYDPHALMKRVREVLDQ